MSLTTTLTAAQRGSRAAQAALLRQYQDAWYRTAIALLGDAEAARDATQETALRFLQKLPAFRGDSQLSTWGTGILINVVREAKRQRRAVTLSDWSERESPREASGDDEAMSALRRLIEQLPARQQEVIVLRYFQELSTEQTAQAMGCAPGTAKATLFQAIRALRRGLLQWV